MTNSFNVINYLVDSSILLIFVLVLLHFIWSDLTSQILAHFSSIFETFWMNTSTVKNIDVLFSVAEFGSVQPDETDTIDKDGWTNRTDLIIVDAKDLLSMLDSDILATIILQESIGFSSSKTCKYKKRFSQL